MSNYLANNISQWGRGNEQKCPNMILRAHFICQTVSWLGSEVLSSLWGRDAFSLNFSKMSSYYCKEGQDNCYEPQCLQRQDSQLFQTTLMPLVPQQSVPTLMSFFSYEPPQKEKQEAGNVPPLDPGIPLCGMVGISRHLCLLLSTLALQVSPIKLVP